MRAWIYDEMDWPSGRAGGRVLKSRPGLIAKNIKLVKTNDAFFKINFSKNYPVQKIVSLIIPEISKTKNIKDKYCSKLSCSFKNVSGIKYVFYQDMGHFQTEYSHEYYVDLLDKETTSTFINYTHEEYYKRFPEYFGSTIIGFFTDEPALYSNTYGRYDIGSISWTKDFSMEFYRKKGYNITDYLYYIWHDDPENMSEKIKQDYFETITDMFSENYFAFYKNWTASHNVLFTGHLLFEEDLHNTIIAEGDFFSHVKYFDIIGTDDIISFNKSKITPRLAASAEFIYGKPYSLTEAFAGYGWDLSYGEVIEVTDWLMENGVDIIVPHAFFYTTEGEEQREDYPPSFFFQNEELWSHMKEYVEYVNYNSKKTKASKLSIVNYPVSMAWRAFNIS